MNDHRISGVLFDLDDTLYDRDLWFMEWATWFVREHLRLTEEIALREAIEFLLLVDGHGYTPRLAAFQQIAERFAILDKPARELLQDFYDHQAAWASLEAGAEQLISGLQAGGVPFGIVTNGSHNQLKKMDKMGLTSVAACCLVSELVGMRKPEPAIFLAAAAQLGQPPERILFVGDNPENDIRGAAAAGMRTAWLRRSVDWPPELSPPDYAVGNLAELLWVCDGSMSACDPTPRFERTGQFGVTGDTCS